MSLIAGLALAAAAACAPAGAENLVGRWESTAKSRGGIGEVLDLRPDGSFVQANAVLVNLRYEVRGDELLIQESKPGGTSGPPATPFRIEGSALIREAGAAQEVRAERSGVAERDPASIVGVWKYRHYAGVIAYERYTPDGELLLRIPMRSLAGCYSVDASRGEIVFTSSATPRPTLAYTVEGATLRLQQPGRRPLEFQRDPWGAWYDIDRIDYVPTPKKP